MDSGPEPSSIGSSRLLAVGAAALVGLASCTLPSFDDASSDPPAAVDERDRVDATVEFVIDGDTVDLVIEGREERVRLIGVDSPESVSESEPVQCYGREAAEALRGLLPPGTAVRVERDEEARDRFGRLLLYVHRSDDGLFVNRWLLEGGFADTLFFEPNTSFVLDFTEARDAAQRDGVGLWGACDGPDQPLD